MKNSFKIMLVAASMAAACTPSEQKNEFAYNNERFADLQLLRYKVEGFDELSLQQKTLIYHLQEAALWGRDILFDQNGVRNLELRRMMEKVYVDYKGDRKESNFAAFEVYLKRFWFSSGIHHHYGCEKFVPGFSREWFVAQTGCKDESLLELIFNPEVAAKRVNQAVGEDLVQTSACNYYQGVTQAEAEAFYAKMKAEGDTLHPIMYGMNSTLAKDAEGNIAEQLWTANGKYGAAIRHIVEHLRQAIPFAEDKQQVEVIEKLIAFYETGCLKTFDEYSIAWLHNTEPSVDFVNGFIESYGDPLGMKASWESIVNFKDHKATERTQKLSDNAQWFETNSPVDPRFKKEKVRGVSAKVINAAILAGDLYPASAIGINLPNSKWVRAEHGSKSVTIGNLTDAYTQAAKGNGMLEEFAFDKDEVAFVRKYGSYSDDLHTDLHECLGHGSGRILPGVDPDNLRAYGSTIEEARADLFALYYLADAKLIELGLLPDAEAYKAAYLGQMRNGLMTQLVRIKLGDVIEESHMRDRALIARWAFEQGKGAAKDGGDVAEMIKRDGKTYLRINDYETLRTLFGKLLAEIQRITSEGDYEAARDLVETYAVQIDPELHAEMIARYEKLNLAPYKGFINPVYVAEKNDKGEIIDVKLDYTEAYADQMLRYSRDYSEAF